MTALGIFGGWLLPIGLTCFVLGLFAGQRSASAGDDEPVDFSDIFVRKCRVCDCTDLDCSGCIERSGAPCWWEEPNLCSACVA